MSDPNTSHTKSRADELRKAQQPDLGPLSHPYTRGIIFVEPQELQEFIDVGWQRMSDARTSLNWEEEEMRVTEALNLSRVRRMPLVALNTRWLELVREHSLSVRNDSLERGGTGLWFHPEVVVEADERLDMCITVREFTGLSGGALARASATARRVAAEVHQPSAKVVRTIGADKHGKPIHRTETGYLPGFLDTVPFKTGSSASN